MMKVLWRMFVGLLFEFLRHDDPQKSAFGLG